MPIINFLGLKDKVPKGLHQQAFVADQLLALMLWPRKEAHRSERNTIYLSIRINSVKDELRKGKLSGARRPPLKPSLAEQLRWLQGCLSRGATPNPYSPSSLRIRKSERLRVRGGITAGWMALTLFSLRDELAQNEARLLGSINRPSELLNAFIKESKGTSSRRRSLTSLTPYANSSRIRREWGKYREVAHLWAAWVSLVVEKRSITVLPAFLEEMLARSKVIGEAISRHRDARYANNTKRVRQQGLQKQLPWNVSDRLRLAPSEFDMDAPAQYVEMLRSQYEVNFEKGKVKLTSHSGLQLAPKPEPELHN